jgi:hypothetical protein
MHNWKTVIIMLIFIWAVAIYSGTSCNWG